MNGATRKILVHGLAAVALASAAPLLGQGQASQALFPSAFVVERSLRELGPGDTVEHQTAPVTEYYGESYLVAVRQGDDRTIVDFARREITEVQISKGTYWVLSFSRMRELRERLARAEAPRDAAPKSATTPAVTKETAVIKVEEVKDGPKVPGRQVTSTSSSSSSTGLRHLRAFVEGGPDSVDVWHDGSIVIGLKGREALRAFESEALGDLVPRAGRASLADLMAAAREQAGGAVPVITRRPLLDRDGRDTGRVMEQIGTRLASLPAFPKKLLLLPETLKRVPSPLETLVSFAEDEAALVSKGR